MLDFLFGFILGVISVIIFAQAYGRYLQAKNVDAVNALIAEMDSEEAKSE